MAKLALRRLPIDQPTINTPALRVCRVCDGRESVELRVYPTLIPEKRLIANVDGVMNAVLVKGDAVGPTLYYGPGAGAEPTASAVIADIIDVARTLTADLNHRVQKNQIFGYLYR